MQLNQYERKVMTNGGETTKFTAEMNGAAFAIFSDTLYQHKIAAVIREICCNAYDSHIEAGCEETPFYVKLPNRFDPNFVVQDWGVGLDDDGVRKVFASYFKSTKNDSVKQTGGFGIGAKSIFSYSSTFEITAIKNGIERKYAAFIGSEGIPEVQIFSETETTDANGVCVKVPVQEKDFVRFSNEADVIMSGFRVTPEVVGRDSTPVHKNMHEKIDEDGFTRISKFTSSSLYSGHDVYALLNNVLYPIPHNVVYLNVDANKLAMVKGNESIIIRFEDGDLAPAAPREFLSLDDTTKEKVSMRIKEVVDKLISFIQDEIDVAEHPMDALRFVEEKLNGNGLSVFQYKGKSLRYHLRRPLKIPNLTSGYVHVTSGGNRLRRFDGKILKLETFLNHHEDEKYYLFYRPVGAKETPIRTHVSKYIKLHNLTNRTRFIIIEGECSDQRLARIEKLCGFEFEKVDSVTLAEEVKKERKAARARQVIGEKTDTSIYAKVVDGNGFVRSVRHNDVSNGVYYYLDAESADQYNETTCVKPWFFGEDVKFIMANSMNMRKIKENNLKSVKEAVKEYVEKNPDVKDFLAYDLVFDHTGFCHKNRHHDFFLQHSQLDEAVELREKHKKYLALREKFSYTVVSSIDFRPYCDMDVVKSLREEVNGFCDKFEFIFERNMEKTVEMFDTYMKTMNNEFSDQKEEV